MDYLIEQLVVFLEFFWSVFSFWALWQVCDWGLHKLKIKLRKPWTLESKDGNSSVETLQPEDRA